jgi:hypothetical protein
VQTLRLRRWHEQTPAVANRGAPAPTSMSQQVPLPRDPSPHGLILSYDWLTNAGASRRSITLWNVGPDVIQVGTRGRCRDEVLPHEEIVIDDDCARLEWWTSCRDGDTAVVQVREDWKIVDHSNVEPASPWRPRVATPERLAAVRANNAMRKAAGTLGLNGTSKRTAA